MRHKSFTQNLRIDLLRSYYNIDAIEAGLDEAGRGCLAGPVVAAAVILPKDYTHTWLNDSKQLNHRQREILRIEIERNAIAFAVAEASNQEIDKINILKASFLAMHRAVDALNLRPEHLLIDGKAMHAGIQQDCYQLGCLNFLKHYISAFTTSGLNSKCTRGNRYSSALAPHMTDEQSGA